MKNLFNEIKWIPLQTVYIIDKNCLGDVANKIGDIIEANVDANVIGDIWMIIRDIETYRITEHQLNNAYKVLETL